MNKENLLVLASYLDTLPLDYEHFEMSDFIRGGDPEKYPVYALKNGGVTATTCGAVACAIGHGPSAGFLFLEEELEDGWHYDPRSGDDVFILRPDWKAYSGRVFVTTSSDYWYFMFGGGWSRVDNTPAGAAARIRFTVKNPDADFSDLSYSKDTNAYADFVKPESREFWENHVNGENA